MTRLHVASVFANEFTPCRWHKHTLRTTNAFFGYMCAKKRENEAHIQWQWLPSNEKIYARYESIWEKKEEKRQPQ